MYKYVKMKETSFKDLCPPTSSLVLHCYRRANNNTKYAKSSEFFTVYGRESTSKQQEINFRLKQSKHSGQDETSSEL